MIRSLYSGVSGMKNHQVRMDTIGNNIANVNTTGFKSARCNFQDLLSQNLRSPSFGDGTNGGVNPGQVGLGMTVAGIANNMQQGPTQTTGRTLDCAIQGNGFFKIKKDDGGGTDDTDTFYTREGIFYVDNAGDLVNSNGYYVCTSDGGRINMGTTNIQTLSISDMGVITVNGTALSEQIGLTSFPNPEGLEKVGQNLYRATAASGNIANSQVTDGYAGDASFPDTRINSGYLEMSNVDLTDEFTNMITTQRGYQANARTITTSDQMLQELLEIKR